MPARSLLDVLRSMKEKDEHANIGDKLARDEWVGELDALMKTIRGWLRPALSEGLVRIDLTRPRVLDDPRFGEYEAPTMRIDLPGRRVVWVKPAGTLAVGAKGWVDVTCGRTRALLVLNRRGIWKARAPDGGARGGKLEPLDETRFARMLADLVA
jgi:hypothetical protein